MNRVFKDKPGGLVVDYLGLAHELKAALATYTESGGTGRTALDQEEAVPLMLEKYEVCCALFVSYTTPGGACGASIGLAGRPEHRPSAWRFCLPRRNTSWRRTARNLVSFVRGRNRSNVSLTGGHIGPDTPAMPLHPVLADQLQLALQPAEASARTRRDARLPAIAGKVHSVIGMRRAGKTTFLHQLRDERREHLPPERAIYLSFDDDRLAGIGVEQLDALLEAYFGVHPELRAREPAYWYLDEIQLVPEWERFCRRVLDTERIELVVSGSSARMLSREVHTSLRGRGMATVIRPFSFREFLRHRGEEPAPGPFRLTPAQRSLVEKRFREFLVAGGFPEAQGLDAAVRVALLQGYVDVVLFRDVVERHKVAQVEALRWLVRQCLRNPAGSLSAHRLHQDLRAQGHGVAKDAVHAMLGYLTDAFLISAVPLATESERRRNSNPRKIYPADPGLIAAFDRSGRANLGHALETAVLNELERRGADLGYVKTDEGYELDFLARYPDAAPELIQVCADPSDPPTLERELRALAAAGREHRRARRLLLVLQRTDVPRSMPAGVEVLPAYEWLLAAPSRTQAT